MVWGGEFMYPEQVIGRPQPLRLHRVDGRRRHQGGTVYGATDDSGSRRWTSRRPSTMHATILPARVRPRKLTYRYAGRDFRLTDVHGHVIRDIVS